MSLSARIKKKKKKPQGAPTSSENTGNENVVTRMKQAGLRYLDQGSQAWYTPWSWADTRRVYYGEDGFWAYYELPESFFYDTTTQFKELIAALKSQRDGRRVHLVQYTWSAPAVLPEQTPPALASMLNELTNLHSTLNSLVVGVQLQPTRQSEGGIIKTTLAGVTEGLDSVLGEAVPDYDSIENDAPCTRKPTAPSATSTPNWPFS